MGAASVPRVTTIPDHETRTRESYDRVAADYAALLDGTLADLPIMRAMFGAFAERVDATGGGPVLDVGCGPGQITAHLATLGLDMSGCDLSPGMIDVARAAYPEVRFTVASMTALDDVADTSLAGLVAWYSTIHVPDELLPVALSEFARVLRPGGDVLLGFHVGSDVHHKTSGYGGHPMDIHVHRRTPERMIELLGAAGFEHVAHMLTAPPPSAAAPQCYLLAHKPAEAPIES